MNRIDVLRDEINRLTFAEMMEVAEALRDRLCETSERERQEALTYANALIDFAENHADVEVTHA